MECAHFKNTSHTFYYLKTHLRSKLSDVYLSRLMHIAIEGLELLAVDFDEILDMYKKQSCRILL